VRLQRLPEHGLLWPVALVPAADMTPALGHAAPDAVDVAKEALRHARRFRMLARPVADQA